MNDKKIKEYIDITIKEEFLKRELEQAINDRYKMQPFCKEYRHNKPRFLCDLDRFVSRIEELSTTHPTESEGENAI